MESEDTWMELHVLHAHGWSITALAREFGLNWRTARRYALASEPPRYRPRLRPAELSAAQLAHVERRLAACPDLRSTVLVRELRADYGYTASYASLRRRVVELRPRETAEPELRFETGPGIQAQRIRGRRCSSSTSSATCRWMRRRRTGCSRWCPGATSAAPSC